MSEETKTTEESSTESAPVAKPKGQGIVEWLKKVLAELVAGDRTKGAKYVVEHPEEFGFSWDYGEIGKGTGNQYRSLRKNAPFIDVSASQLPLFLTTWGPKLVSSRLKGQSIKVACDRVDRDTLDKAPNTTNAQLKERIVLSVLYEATLKTVYERVVEKTKWVVNGTVYTTEAEYNVAMAKTTEDDTDKATRFVSMAVEKGMSVDDAIEMARGLFPKADFGGKQDEDQQEEVSE